MTGPSVFKDSLSIELATTDLHHIIIFVIAAYPLRCHQSDHQQKNEQFYDIFN